MCSGRYPDAPRCPMTSGPATVFASFAAGATPALAVLPPTEATAAVPASVSMPRIVRCRLMTASLPSPARFVGGQHGTNG